MRKHIDSCLVYSVSLIALVAASSPACAQTVAAAPTAARTAPVAQPSENAVGEIIVTAQKRAQSINSVGMSIAAVSGDALKARGITTAADLVKSIPGFVYNETALGTPIYTLRGVGFVDQSLSAGPTVSVYVDEVPLPFAFMTKGAIFDLERVEVLKGPQGTLYGQNSTGGAFNYIAAKPTSKPTAGIDAEYGRFNTLDTTAYISGPVTDTLKARLAVRTVQGDDWQYSYTRHDSLGKQNQWQARGLVDWAPTDRLTVNLNFTGWIDHSDTIAPQVRKIDPQVPSGVLPAIANYPLPPDNDRAADWDPNQSYRRNDWFAMASARINYRLTDDIQLISISAYQRFHTSAFYDNDGYDLQTGDRQGNGNVRTFNQEVRLTGDVGPVKWIVGADYSHYKVNQNFDYFLKDASNAHGVFAGLVGPLGPNGDLGTVPADGLSFSNSGGLSNNVINSYAGFGNLEWNVTSRLNLQGGIRFTQTNRDASSCAVVQDEDGVLLSEATQQFYKNIGLKTTPVVAVQPGDCSTLDINYNPAASIARLREHNISWRVGANWKTDGHTLLYGNVSKGYKAGSVPDFSASTYLSELPVKQESLLAYEVGFKAPLFNHTMQLNGAAFYYDYRNKQIYVLLQDLIFGGIQQLVNIPKSDIKGAELELQWRPFRGLNLSASGTFIDSKIKSYTGYNAGGVFANYKGDAFPYAPKWQLAADAQYEWALNERLKAYVGGDVPYHSKSTAAFGNDLLIANGKGNYDLNAYALLDLRAGVESPDGHWRVGVFGRNVTNKYYWTTVEKSQDAVIRYAGKPATYGVQLGFKFQ